MLTDDGVYMLPLRGLVGEDIRQPVEDGEGADELRADAVHELGQLLQRGGELHLRTPSKHNNTFTHCTRTETMLRE